MRLGVAAPNDLHLKGVRIFSFAVAFKSSRSKALDLGSFDGSIRDPFLLLRQGSRPNFHPNPRSAESAGVEASRSFLDMGLPDKILPQLEELVPVPSFVNFPAQVAIQ